MRLIKITGVLIVLVLSTFSCKKGGVFCYNGNDNIVIEQRDLTDFNEIELATAGDIYLKQGPEFEVKVQTSENLLDIIVTKIVNGKLVIELKKGKCLKSKEVVNFFITAPNIDAISVSGSGSVNVENKIYTEKLSLNISGSGDVEIDSLMVSELVCKISGSGDVEISGIDTVSTFDFSISGSGEIETHELVSKKGKINISGSGECSVNVIEELNVKISGSGDVRYKGTPIISSDISGSGNLYPY